MSDWPSAEDRKFAEETGVCPYSGLPGPECKSWLCDCLTFDDLWGPSQK